MREGVGNRLRLSSLNKSISRRFQTLKKALLLPCFQKDLCLSEEADKTDLTGQHVHYDISFHQQELPLFSFPAVIKHQWCKTLLSLHHRHIHPEILSPNLLPFCKGHCIKPLRALARKKSAFLTFSYSELGTWWNGGKQNMCREGKCDLLSWKQAVELECVMPLQVKLYFYVSVRENVRDHS